MNKVNIVNFAKRKKWKVQMNIELKTHTASMKNVKRLDNGPKQNKHQVLTRLTISKNTKTLIV